MTFGCITPPKFNVRTGEKLLNLGSEKTVLTRWNFSTPQVPPTNSWVNGRNPVPEPDASLSKTASIMISWGQMPQSTPPQQPAVYSGREVGIQEGALTGASRLIRKMKTKSFFSNLPNFGLSMQLVFAKIGDEFVKDFIIWIRIVHIRIKRDPPVRWVSKTDCCSLFRLWGGWGLLQGVEEIVQSQMGDDCWRRKRKDFRLLPNDVCAEWLHLKHWFTLPDKKNMQCHLPTDLGFNLGG